MASTAFEHLPCQWTGKWQLLSGLMPVIWVTGYHLQVLQVLALMSVLFVWNAGAV